MFTLFKSLDKKKLLEIELPAIFISMITAEHFYKFGSFTLECIGFLCTWVTVGFIINTIKQRMQ